MKEDLKSMTLAQMEAAFGTLGVPNLVLYHTEDKNIQSRKALYTEEGKPYYHGNLIVPDDLETLEL